MKKQSIGIDISKAYFTACICIRRDGQNSYSEIKNFKNTRTGFNQLTRWVQKHTDSDLELVFIMEATGVYHENLAYHLHKIKKCVHVVLPNTSKHFFKSMNIKTKTDEIDAKILSLFGVERSHMKWQPPNPIHKKIKELTRYHLQLKEQRTAMINIKHAKEDGFEVMSFIIKNNKKIINSLEKMMETVLVKLKEMVAADSELEERILKVCTIKGVSLLTAATVIAEMNGFESFSNRKQITSFAGYDVVHNESGSSIKGKTRISKKGNRYIRQALYMPGMSACRYNEELKRAYLRIIKRSPSKMVGQVAIQRKLLLLIYTLWKNNDVYRADYYQQKIAQRNRQATQDKAINAFPIVQQK